MLDLGAPTANSSTIVKRNDSILHRKKGAQSSSLYNPDDIVYSFGENSSKQRSGMSPNYEDYEEIDEEMKENSSLLNTKTYEQ